MRLKDKVALITGASKGIGRQIALDYMREGARVIGSGRSEADLISLADEAKAFGGEFGYELADMTQKQDVVRMVSAAAARYGRLDILVNNAGQMFYGGLLEISEEDWDRAMTVNLKSQFLCMQMVIPYMQKQGGGRVINMSSTGGKSATTITGLQYAVTKAGIMYMTKRVAQNFGKDGIIVNCIAPGTIDTAMSRTFSPDKLAEFTKNIPVGRIGLPEDVAQLAIFLGSDECSYITGEVIDINGGSYID